MFIATSMTRDVITIRGEAGLFEAKEKMELHAIRHLPVVAEDNTLIGIITDRDIRSALPSVFTARMNDPQEVEGIANLKVRDVMTKNPVTISPLNTLGDALLLMHRARKGALPVVDKQGNLTGIISTSDVMRAFINVLGIEQPGTLLCILAEKKVGQMKKIVDAITEEGISFGSILVANYGDEGKRAVYPYLLTNNVAGKRGLYVAQSPGMVPGPAPRKIILQRRQRRETRPHVLRGSTSQAAATLFPLDTTGDTSYNIVLKHRPGSRLTREKGGDMAAKEANSGGAKQMVFLVILVLFAALFAVSLLVKDRRAGKKIIMSGDRAPEFRLPAPDGRQVGLSDFRGKVVMVHFWATWCPPCVEEIPTLDRLYRELRGGEFELLAVSVDEGGAEAVTAFMKKNRLNVPVLLDPERKAAGLYGTFKFPETYLVDRRGVVRYKAIGPSDWGTPANGKIVRDLLEAR